MLTYTHSAELGYVAISAIRNFWDKREYTTCRFTLRQWIKTLRECRKVDRNCP
jgi:hypothetical protein